MKKLIFYFLISVISVILFTCKSNPIIVGEIEGMGNDTLYVYYHNMYDHETPPHKRTVLAQNGKFSFDIPIEGFTRVSIIPGKGVYVRHNNSIFYPSSKNIVVYLSPNEKVKIKGNFSSEALHYTIETPGFNQKFTEHTNTYKYIQIVWDQMDMRHDSLIRVHASDEQLYEAYHKPLPPLLQERNKIRENYIRENPDNEISAMYLTRIPLDSVFVLYNNLSQAIKNGRFKPLLDQQLREASEYYEYLAAEKNIKAGIKAPDFSLPDINNKTISLSALKGKYIVLDFWGTWCPPCVNSFPKLKEYYKKYSSKLEIVGIDCEESIEEWKEGVNKYELPWMNLYNSKEDKLEIIYGIGSYPTYIVINPEGIIIEKYIGAGQDLYDKIDELMK